MKGIYIHIPFCIRKCDYCDFISFSSCEKKHAAYIDTLIKEMQQYRGQQADSIFIGGGTPTALSAGLLDRLLCAVWNIFEVLDGCEFSIEANPKTLDEEKIKVLIRHGVNRVSIGVQSFQDQELKTIGRIHTRQDAYNTICMVKNMGIDNINIDLMSALPNQTMELFLDTLKQAVSLEPQHISCYSLILEEHTPLERRYSKGEITVPDEETDRRMYRAACEFLERHGYHQYEISNFAKTGQECRHNIKYWSCMEYIGLGVAAHSYINGIRFYNTSDLDKYISGAFHEADKIVLTQNDKMEEFMIMGLRMKQGVAKSEFFSRFGVQIENVYGTILEKYKKQELLIEKNGQYYLSSHGIDISNTILCEFMF